MSISEYRAELYTYLKNRMAAIAPNLTSLVGELVGKQPALIYALSRFAYWVLLGARLIAHTGSLLNLAKQPASTVQILGAEKGSVQHSEKLGSR